MKIFIAFLSFLGSIGVHLIFFLLLTNKPVYWGEKIIDIVTTLQ